MNKIHILNRIGSVPYFFIRLVGKAQEKRLMTMQQLQYRKFNTPNVHKRPLGFIFLCK